MSAVTAAPAAVTVPGRPPDELERRENFPVAARALPRALRTDLRAVYAAARVIDDAGDEGVGDRTRRLDAVEAELRAVWSDHPPTSGPFAPLARTVRVRGLGPEPFLDLVEANRVDQVRQRYATWAELRDYCALSAVPVGRVVLTVVGASTPNRVRWSDDVCTALQLLEHCQDVGEDLRRGRVYIPMEDLARFGVTDGDLAAPVAGANVRAVVAFQVERARALLEAGRPLVRSLRGWGRVAVAGYVAGGLATADAIERADHDVLAGLRRPRGTDTVVHALGLLVGRSR